MVLKTSNVDNPDLSYAFGIIPPVLAVIAEETSSLLRKQDPYSIMLSNLNGIKKKKIFVDNLAKLCSVPNGEEEKWIQFYTKV